MPDKEFLEEYSLFRKFKTEVPEYMHQIQYPPINMWCDKCKSNQTFNSIASRGDIGKQAAGERFLLIYRCQSCHLFTREFNIFISYKLDYFYKYGQYPEWEIKIDKNLENNLGKYSGIFKKGLVCESQGYGIGAFAYYRRIIEQIIDELLNSIKDLIDDEHKEKYIKALEETKKTRVAQEKIDLIKDLLPTILRPNNANPLGVLHSELSRGLHSNTDEDCLEIACHIKEVLIFLLNQVAQSKETAKQFTDSMKKLLDKKNQRIDLINNI